MKSINSSNTCSVIVSYNPDGSLIENVRVISAISYKVIIVDNGSVDSFAILRSIQTELSNIILIINESNLGIAKALNIGIKRALEFFPKWIITFDQDSIPLPQFLWAYNKALSKISSKRSLGLLSCGFSDEIFPAVKQIQVQKKHTIITSGCLHNVDLFSVVGFYNESLFIDCVDFDFSLRVAKSGFATYRITQKLLLHHLGNPSKRKFLFWDIYSTNHSLMRRYYMSRNHFYLSKKYFTRFPFYIVKKNLFFFFMILQLLYVEVERKNKILIMWKGFLDSFKM